MDFYLLGIGGIGQSALAQILTSKGFRLAGSDISENDEVRKLVALGIHVDIGHKTENLPTEVFTVVRIPAIAEDNPELVEAKRRGLRVITRTQCLAEIFADAIQIAVAGTHGKTTTSALLSSIFLEGGYDPSFMIGGNLPGHGNARVGKGPQFIFEADEYAEQFLDFRPTAAIILNVEPDHLDYYGSYENVKKAFKNFVGRIAEFGVLVVGSSVPQDVYEEFKGMLLVVGEGRGEIIIKNLQFEAGLPAFDVYVSGDKLAHMKLKVPGRHNAFNAACAYALALSAGVQPESAEKAIASFGGVERRFQIYSESPELTVVDDFAHHPTEVRATIAAARERFPGKKIVVVFQPHQFSRTKQFLDEFAQELSSADQILLAPIYRARDTQDSAESVTIGDLTRKISVINPNVKDYEDYNEITGVLLEILKSHANMIVITMGAAPTDIVAKQLVKGAK